jgi:tyrosinase
MSYPSTDNDTSSQIREWSVSISVSKFDYNGKRFIIRLFLGTVPPNPRNWATNNGSVGSFDVLPPMGIAPAPRANWPNVTAHNEIPLMQGLAEKGYDGQYVTATVEYLRIICNGECRL